MGGSRDSCYRTHRLMDVFVIPTSVRLGSSVSLGLGPPQAYLGEFFTLTCMSAAIVFSKKWIDPGRTGCRRCRERAETRLCGPEIADLPRSGRRISDCLSLARLRAKVTDLRLVLPSSPFAPVGSTVLRPRRSRLFSQKNEREGIFVSTFRPWQTPIEQPGTCRCSPEVCGFYACSRGIYDDLPL